MLKWWRQWLTRARMPWCEWAVTIGGDWYCMTHDAAQARQPGSSAPLRCAAAIAALEAVR